MFTDMQISQVVKEPENAQKESSKDTTGMLTRCRVCYACAPHEIPYPEENKQTCELATVRKAAAMLKHARSRVCYLRPCNESPYP